MTFHLILNQKKYSQPEEISHPDQNIIEYKLSDNNAGF
jgi:hypothetical protein